MGQKPCVADSEANREGPQVPCSAVHTSALVAPTWLGHWVAKLSLDYYTTTDVTV